MRQSDPSIFQRNAIFLQTTITPIYENLVSRPSPSRQTTTMPFNILQVSVVFALCLLASGRRQWVRPDWRLPAIDYHIGAVDDWVPSGNYEIYSCSSQASKVKNLLDLTWLYIQNALLSTNTPAYKAFFRSADPSSVKTVLSAIAAGNNITDEAFGPTKPTLVCVNAVDPGLTLLWKICSQPSKPIITQFSSNVFLCPVFFEKDVSPIGRDCGIVNLAQTRLGTYSNLLETQYSHLTMPLADMYIRDIFPGVTQATSARPRSVNECLALPPDESVKSAWSYSYFLSSKS